MAAEVTAAAAVAAVGIVVVAVGIVGAGMYHAKRIFTDTRMFTHSSHTTYTRIYKLYTRLIAYTHYTGDTYAPNFQRLSCTLLHINDLLLHINDLLLHINDLLLADVRLRVVRVAHRLVVVRHRARARGHALLFVAARVLARL